MISLWETVQGLAFLLTFGLLSRSATRQAPDDPSRAPSLAADEPLIPTPRSAQPEEHGTAPVG